MINGLTRRKAIAHKAIAFLYVQLKHYLLDLNQGNITNGALK